MIYNIWRKNLICDSYLPLNLTLVVIFWRWEINWKIYKLPLNPQKIVKIIRKKGKKEEENMDKFP